MNCKCFQCKTDYQSNNPDDIAGDGRCEGCAARAKAMAIKVNAEISNQRLNGTSLLAEFMRPDQVQGLQLDQSGRIIGGRPMEPINISQLGITPHG